MGTDLVTRNPQFRKPVAAVLAAFESQDSLPRAYVETCATQRWSDAWAHDLGTTIAVLVRNGALEEKLAVDGEPYAGTLADMQHDESVSLDADVTCTLTITDDGRALALSTDPTHMLAELFAERPHYGAVFTRVLDEAQAPAGASRVVLEQAVERDGNVVDAQGKRVYPQYFLDALETAGGIVWADGAWHATDVAAQFASAAAGSVHAAA